MLLVKFACASCEFLGVLIALYRDIMLFVLFNMFARAIYLWRRIFIVRISSSAMSCGVIDCIVAKLSVVCIVFGECDYFRWWVSWFSSRIALERLSSVSTCIKKIPKITSH